MTVEHIDVSKVSLRIWSKVKYVLDAENDLGEIKRLCDYRPSFLDKVKDFFYVLFLNF